MSLSVRILSWALIFISRLRFPPGKSLVAILSNRYNGSLKALRTFQGLDLKLGKCKLDFLFLLSCKDSNLIPKFLWFKLANRNLRNSHAYRSCQRRLFDEEIRQKCSRIKSLLDQVSSAYSNLSSLVSIIDLVHLKYTSDKENAKRIVKHQKIQEKKLLRLCSNSPTANLIIFNFSDRVLTQKEKKILSRGLNFATPRSKLDYCDFLVPFGLIQRQLRCESISNSTTEQFFKTRNKPSVISNI